MRGHNQRDTGVNRRRKGNQFASQQALACAVETGQIEVRIDGRVAMTSSREILRDIATRHGPEKALVAFGYAGWAAGQLESELALRGWFTAAEDLKLIFDTDRDKVWDDAMAHRTQDL